MTVTSTPVWHDIFRKITLKPDNITLEAETYEDTLNIVRGPGVNFGTVNTGSDTFEINVDYDISVPAATTKISLEDVNGNLSEITLTPGRGVAINRISAQELEFESFSVTETDTLHTVTERNNITSNKIFVNNIEVGTIASNTSEDGFTGYDAGHNLIGDGTLDNPMRFSPLYQDSLVANNTDQFEFIAVGPGTLAYAANYVFDTAATTGSVTLEREDPANPGNWTTLDTQSGNTAGIAYFIDGTYSELYSGSVTYRLTFSWTGNTGTATWYTNDTFEGGAYTPIANPQIKTDTDAKTVDINDIQFFQNTIRTTASNTDVVFDLSGTGQVRVLGNITADMLYGNVTGNLTGNADTVTNGVYTTGSYSDPTWITSLNASKIVGEINLSNITIDGTIRIFDNVIETTVSNADLELRPSGTGQVRIIGDVSANMFYGNVTGNISGNASTVTNGVYTTGSYYDPSWITALDSNKLVGNVNFNNIRIYDNVIETTQSNSDLEIRTSGIGNVIVYASIIPPDDLTYDLGAPSQQWNSLYVGGNTIYIGGVPLGIVDGSLIVDGNTVGGPSDSMSVAEVITTLAVWSSGGTIPGLVAAREGLGGAGTQSAALAFGGGDINGNTGATNEYDGTTWTASDGLSSLATLRGQHAGAGTQTAAFAAAGEQFYNVFIDSTEEYDGTSWSAGGTVPASLKFARGAGTVTAGLLFGGQIVSTAKQDSTYEYDGTTWTSGGNLLQPRSYHGGSGSQTAALTAGGLDDNLNDFILNAEEYNGTAWISGGNLLTSRYYNTVSGGQTTALAVGGEGSSSDLDSVESYDGITWSTTANALDTRKRHAAAGDSVDGLIFGGVTSVSSPSATSEEYTGPTTILPTTSGTKGQIRYNDHSSKFEGHTGSAWIEFGVDTTAQYTWTNTQEFNANVGIGISSPETKLDINGSFVQNIVVVAASNVDCSAGNYFTKTVSGALNWTVTNVPASRSYSFILELTNGGSGTQTWFSGTKWAGGAAPTLTTTGVDLLGFITDDGGTSWNGILIGKDLR